MNRRLLTAAGLLAAGALLAAPVLLGLIAVLFHASANAAQNPCISASGVVPPVGGSVRLPVVGEFSVTSEFGMRYNPGDVKTGEYRMHWGLDLQEAAGEGPVVAVMAGVVRSMPTTAEGGNEIYIDHGGSVLTGYLHLSSYAVTVGERVWAGKQLGKEGNTGDSSGSHLQFEVHLNGEKVDPRVWLTQRGVIVPPPLGTGRAPGAVPGPPGPAAGSGATSPPPAGTELATPAPMNPSGTPGLTQPVSSNLPAQVGPYKGEQIINAGHVIKAGQALNLDAKTVTIGVMTAMGESSLINVAHGDAAGPDSRGLFQQRDNGAWGTLADRMNPTIAATNFFQALLAVPGYLDLEPTIAVHRTQRNADPYYYRPFWADAVLMVATLTGDPALLESLPVTGPIVGCENGGPGAPPEPGDGSGAAIVAAARHYLGTPYSWGGGDINGPSLGVYSSPSLDGTHTVGFDCSGLVIFAVHNATALQLPHSAETQGQDPRGTTITRDWAAILPGDVISFSEDGSGAPGSFGHVGIYIGGGQMIHAPQPGKTVEIVQLQGSNYYEPMVWSIKRYWRPQ